MERTVTVPDDLSAGLEPRPGTRPRRFGGNCLEAYRRRRITGYQRRILLGIGTRYELDGFLKQHEICDYTTEDFDLDLATIRQLHPGVVVAEAIREATQAQVFDMPVGEAGGVKVSVGVATFPDHASTGDQLVANADKALYHAKRLGKNQTCVYRRKLQTRDAWFSRHGIDSGLPLRRGATASPAGSLAPLRRDAP